MKVAYLPFDDALREYISCFMLFRASSESEANTILHPPTNECGFCFHFGESIAVKKKEDTAFIEQPAFVVVGPQLSTVQIRLPENYLSVRLGLQPCVLYRFTGMPLLNYTDRSISGEDIWGATAVELSRVLKDASGIEEIRQCILDFFRKLVDRSKPFHKFDACMRKLVEECGNYKIQQLCEDAGMCIRQFERLGLVRLGMSPKTFARIARFSCAYRMGENAPNPNWTDIAYKSGYFDVIHLIRDFKEFTGHAPKSISQMMPAPHIRMQASLRHLG
ncbi:helix-turn-helix domain-containing protein [Niabella hirudinis]|uniref:helix-turn-helix domain-containing protein n=1 Tax=Niabella hirudinis TaxID=1285929 RepID=UPI003EB702CB